ADALEEMDEAQRDRLIRHLDPTRAVAILAEMEPDEAAEALRELPADHRARLLSALPDAARLAVGTILGYGENTAGGLMTPVVGRAEQAEPVTHLIDRLRTLDAHRADIDGVLVVAASGRLLDDISLFELATADTHRMVGELVGPPWPIVVN